jgi:hypothetical protein
VDCEDHVTCKVANAYIEKCRDIIKQLMTCGGQGFRALSLLGCYSTDGRRNGQVNRTSVIEECYNNILHAFDAFFGEWGCGVPRNCLQLCSKLYWGSHAWCMLWLWQSLVLVFKECLVDVVWHVEINRTIDVVQC